MTSKTPLVTNVLFCRIGTQMRVIMIYGEKLTPSRVECGMCNQSWSVGTAKQERRGRKFRA